MANLVHKQFFSGGMDKDIHPKNIEQGNYLYALNMRNGKTDSENFGAMTNTRGNVLIPYELPQGHNKCIGTLEDKQSERIIWFVWNSLNEHSILAYRQKTNDIVKVLQGEYLGFQEDMLITDPSIIDGHLVQWRETKLNGLEVSGNPLRYIDVNRAILSDKKVKFDIIVANGEFNAKTSSYSVKLTIGGTDIIQPLIQGHENAPNEPNSKADLYKRLKDVLNAEFSHLLVADDCGGCRLEVEFLIEGDCWIEITSDKDDFMSLPQNRYHKDIDSTTISLGRLVPFREPKAQAIHDSNYKYNYISDKYFQFATRYVYFDGQKSTFSDFSEIVKFQDSCKQYTSGFNAIEVDFSDPILKSELRTADIKRIEIIAREGNSGSFNIVGKIDVCDISYPNQIFVFRNDGQYSAVSDTDAYMSFSQIPLLSTAHTVVDDRGWYGGTLERYDNLDCVDAKAKVEFVEQEDCGDTVTIKGRIRVQGLESWLGQPIWKSEFGSGEIYFGGLVSSGIAGKGYSKTAKQLIPLGGFVVYLAGTEYYGIAKHPKYNIEGVKQDEDNVFVIENSTDAKRLYILQQGGRATPRPLDIYCEFEIKNVPKGNKYIARVASHLCYNKTNPFPSDVIGDAYDISKGLEFQRTSTYVIGNLRMTSSLQKSHHEFIIDTNTSSDEIWVGVRSGGWIVRDFIDPYITTAYIQGYVVDSNGSAGTSDVYKGIAIEYSDVEFKSSGEIFSRTAKTDHNGFFFGASTAKLSVSKVSKFGQNIWANGLHCYGNNLFSLGDSSTTPKTENDIDQSAKWGEGGLSEFTVYNHSEDLSDMLMPFELEVVNTMHNPISGAVLTLEGVGRYGTTDNVGKAIVRAYIDQRNPAKITEVLGYVPSDPCCLKLEEKEVLYIVSKNSPESSRKRELVASIKNFNTSFWKRRSRHKLGIIYQDEYNRQTKVQTSDDLDVYIPFYTESDANKKPIIRWEINHKPPTWATKYQIVRTIDSIYANYLQFVTNKPKYFKSYKDDGSIVETTYEAKDAAYVYIPLSSIAEYEDDNYGTVVSWEINEGDRLTLLRDNNGDFYDKMYDYEVVNTKVRIVDDITYLIIRFDSSQPEIKEGSSIEVYNLKKEPQLDLFYMIGQTYPIENGMHLGGEDGQDQTSLQPAVGYLHGGDTFVTRRSMSYHSAGTSYPVTYPFETMFSNEMVVGSRVQDIGRLVSADNDYKQNFYYTRVRHTGRYLPDTNVNLLNIFTELGYFQDENKTEIDRQFGVLMSLAYTGGSVLAILQFKCVPIYTNATPVFDLSGEQSILTKSRSIANIAQPFVEDKGTQNPESVLVQNGRVFAWDGLRGVFWRYASNGQFNISDYGMINEFYEVSKQLKGIEAKVVTGYDRKNRQMIVSFTDLNKTISFDERLSGDTYKNTWSSEWTYIPDMFVTLGEQMFSFKNGSLYKHGEGDYNTFYGRNGGCEIHFVVNNNPDVKKVFTGMRQKSNAKFITLPFGIEAHDGEETMYSELRDAHIERLEGDYWADILRDMTDKEFANIEDIDLRDVTSLLKGRVMRGDYAVVKLRNTENKLISLYSVEVFSYSSHKTME